ncbi:SdpI family protein [Rummeliibacillus stabekisii]|uniref:SdpI family protein n=1 Tax=Rummeliibacillus stabekisii TaxID=241244 RepID=UPI003720B70F
MKNLLLLFSSFFISLIIWLSSYSSLPERVIMHVDSSGPTEYAPKGFMFIMFMIISFCVLVVFYGLLLIDRKNENKQKMNKAFAMIGSLFVIGLNIVYILNVHNESLNTESLFLIFVGCIFIIIGNYLPTVNYNSKVGIRNVASYKNKKSWNKIHRFGGNIFVICGILIGFAALIPSFVYAILAILLIIAAMLYIIQVYSNRVFENDE